VVAYFDMSTKTPFNVLVRFSDDTVGLATVEVDVIPTLEGGLDAFLAALAPTGSPDVQEVTPLGITWGSQPGVVTRFVTVRKTAAYHVDPKYDLSVGDLK
jgi:voltage-gated potassium channel Kch